VPKENTHLYFSRKIIAGLPDGELKNTIRENLDFFNLGTVFPDLFLYSLNKKEQSISDALHGKDGEATNKIIFELLENARKKQSAKELSFALGYLSHCVMDIVFHPVIIYLTGNIFSPDPKKNREAIHRHHILETFLDMKVNGRNHFKDIVKAKAAENMDVFKILENTFNVSAKKAEKIFRRQYFVNGILGNKFFYALSFFLEKIGLLNKKYLELLHINLNDYRALKNMDLLPEKITYLDLITGVQNSATLDDLFEKATGLAVSRIESAFDFYQDKITEEVCLEIIQGESMETGKINAPVSEIRYTDCHIHTKLSTFTP
jgi:hypothetical protein